MGNPKTQTLLREVETWPGCRRGAEEGGKGWRRGADTPNSAIAGTRGAGEGEMGRCGDARYLHLGLLHSAAQAVVSQTLSRRLSSNASSKSPGAMTRVRVCLASRFLPKASQCCSASVRRDASKDGLWHMPARKTALPPSHTSRVSPLAASTTQFLSTNFICVIF